MRVTFDDNEFTANVSEMLKKMESTCKKEQASFLKRCGEILKKCVISSMKKNHMRSKINSGDYVHMMDDVQYKVKKSKSGDTFVSVGGGRKTGYKWRFLNDGAIDQRGNVTNEANHFMETAINDASSELEQEINKVMEKVVK